MGILCGHWNCGGSFGLGIAEDHGIRNRNDMGVDTGKNPYSVLYSARVYCGRSHYRDISKVIRGLSGRYGNRYGKSKKEKRYEYKNMLVMMIAALLPLLIGSSVGPEAGLTGIIVGLCYWAGENLKFAKQNTKEYSQIGAAVSLSVLFHAPLFGIFEVEEDPDMQLADPGRGSKIFIYGIALAAGTGSYAGLSALLGGGMSGFPSFDAVAVQRIDYVMMLVYMFCGCVLAYFYETTHTVTGIIAGKIPGVVKEILAGLCLGVIGMLIPAVMFSGEEQMGVLMKEYAGYMAIALIGAAFLKIILTNLCIQFGLKGGHFFPVIFAGVCLGYGLAMLFFGQQGIVMLYLRRRL